ncbi:hypothetical protein, partial [Edwardsiella anguillarum]|uniref:hypothetical protein n=1 Tax=Edwardsiella anguillarum TaxID=1821960 RepID=UPI004059F9B3
LPQMNRMAHYTAIELLIPHYAQSYPQRWRRQKFVELYANVFVKIIAHQHSASFAANSNGYI